MKYVVIPLQGGAWAWELRAADGSALCRSTGHFAAREHALESIKSLRTMARSAQVMDLHGNACEPTLSL